MKCTNSLILTLCILTLFALTGCSETYFAQPYDYRTRQSAFSFDNASGSDTAPPFAAGLCVASDENSADGPALNGAVAAGLFDVNACGTLYSKEVHERLAPASLTKVMTALVALKYGHPDDMITASSAVNITESGAQLVGIKEGDRMSLEQALHGLLMYSGNDAAVVIAEYISGNVDEFCLLMNEEANKLGATNTHFVNPHGLSADDHYTTAYDLYLIFNEAMKYDKFREIIGKSEYQTTYSDRDGNSKEMDITNSNLYLTGDKNMPSGVTVLGGKTGTTNKAGSCLILLSNDDKGNPYISVILKAADKDILYTEMTTLLEQIP